MHKADQISSLALAAALVAGGWSIPAFAQEGAGEVSDGATIIVTGTRRTDRTVADSTVPIDVISSESLQNSGTTETNRLLNQLVPSFNFPQPSLTDGTDSLRPATLRGLSPDQVLVLVNGKRRHLSSLLNLNGSIGRGSAGVDMNTIPPLAIERIEVLRDGAASQYGSDAIAGVINIQLKKREGGRAQISFGKYITTMDDVAEVASVAPTAAAGVDPVITFTGKDRKRRDGDTYTFATNVGLPIGEGGYFNFTAEYKDRSPSNRSGADIRRQYAGIGDPRETTFNRYSHRFGDGESKDLNFFVNAGMDVGTDWELYSFGSYGIRDANGAGFYRRALDPRNADWANGGQPFYPDGFLPLITSRIEDIAIAGGIRGETGGWNLDLSVNYGSNRLDYGVENTFNTSLGGLASPRKFDAGGLRSGQTSVNFDATHGIDFGIGDTTLALGGEWRNENYRIVPGQLESYVAGPFTFTNGAAPGAQVFPGFSPTTAVDKSRDSFAGYVELDADISEIFNVQAAGRYEHFSDFGDTVNGKLAARLEPVEGLALRGSVSTGFRAPGMAQQYFSTTSTNNVNGVLIEIGTFPVGSPIAVALGAEPLKPEKSVNFGGGIAFNMVPGLSLTVDYYRIKIKDRITLTENLQGADVVAILQAAGVQGTSARFFINGIDTRTQGLDIVGSYRLPDFGIGKVTLTAGYNINETKITDRRTFSGFTAQRLFARPESFRLTDGQPSNKLNVGFDWESGPAGLTLRANRYGKVFLPGPSLDITVPKGAAPGDITLTPKWVVDLEFRFRPVEPVQLAIGANNLLDEYPDRLPFGTVNGFNFGLNNSFLPYSSQSPFGFSGRFVYGRLSVDF
ncbi:TonB-dependent Receptor Plug domain protein [Sphingopyxis sp. LC81]|uniref:TonB-dependent receptor plug domain-containing protein n=1 Tax=Sphingopyxis sp. LC81 TaxID=1502850 RepID=UPI00050E9081|nr:TonB-dependent receptor [Sphingopyxis sp. LC81]KGB51704.1 TonB-dependent Receptor Plug domain protein [Sphingopyxis sp. LC81]